MKKTLICILAAINCFAGGSFLAQQPAPTNLERIELYYQEAKEKGLLDGVMKKNRTPLNVDLDKLTHHQAEAVKYFNSLKSMPLGSSNTPLENQLIAIDVEFECKKLIIDLLHGQGQIDLGKQQELKAKLNHDMFQKMKKAAAASNEHAIGQYVEEMASLF